MAASTLISNVLVDRVCQNEGDFFQAAKAAGPSSGSRNRLAF